MADKQTEEQEDTNEEPEETVYLYRIPLETNGVSKEAAYSAGEVDDRYLTYFGTTECVVIQGTAAGHLHRDDVNAKVEELSKAEVEASDNLREDFA